MVNFLDSCCIFTSWLGFNSRVFILEQPIQFGPRTPTFLLGLEQVVALVDASGKKVGNQVADRLTSEKVFTSNYYRSVFLRFLKAVCFQFFDYSSTISAEGALQTSFEQRRR